MRKGGVSEKMNMGKRISAAIGMVLVASTAQAKDFSGSYLCTATAIAEVQYDDTAKAWRSISAPATNRHHTIRVKAVPFNVADGDPVPKNGAYSFAIKPIDLLKELSPYNCLGALQPFEIVAMFGEMVECKTPEYGLVLNFANMKYQMLNTGGYIYDLDGPDAMIEVGTCTSLD